MPSVFFSEDDMCTTQKLQIARVQDWFIVNGWDVADTAAAADMPICLTCNGWKLLTTNSFNRISQMQKQVSKDALVVFGCLNDAHPKKVAEVHSGKTISNANIDSQIDSLIPDAKIKFADVPHSSEFRTKEDYRVYDLTKQFVNIANGCTFNCSFCHHKPGLGDRRSRTIDDIVEQVKRLVKFNVRIVVLTGMETSFYGQEHGTNFAEMLKAVLAVDDSFEVHIAQFQPQGVHKMFDELGELLQSKRVTDFQLPIQTTSNRLLKMMKRADRTDKVGPFVEKIREKNTRIIIRTDLIVGWPTETMEELEDSLAFAVKYFDEIAVYEIELDPDLPAWKYQKDEYPVEERRRRVLYAKNYIERHGRMAHCGQQDDATMEEVELKRQEMRLSRGVA
ncbi:radical SAM protein [Paraglaciecola sp.]|uniref:radical SAM protein n=1 Tax=Paraglaciecola sp. TaxID=1920173 RepID=UPI003EF85C15